MLYKGVINIKHRNGNSCDVNFLESRTKILVAEKF